MWLRRVWLRRVLSGLSGPKSHQLETGRPKFHRNSFSKNNKATFAATLAGMLAALAALSAAPAQATTVSYTDTQVYTANGKDLFFNFENLLPSDGTGGTITIASGISENYPGVYDGLELRNASEHFELTFDGISQGTYNCTGNGGHTPIPDAITPTTWDCQFELTIALEGPELERLLTDALISIGVLFSDGVEDWNERDQVIVTLEYTEAVISEVPLPAALPLFIAGIAGIGAASRRRKAGRRNLAG